MGVKLGTRAFIVSDPCGDFGAEVVFADSPGQAKANGMTEHLTFTERAVKRAANLDKYQEVGGPTAEQLFCQAGWWYPCRECDTPTTADDGSWNDSGALCNRCQGIERF